MSLLTIKPLDHKNTTLKHSDSNTVKSFCIEGGNHPQAILRCECKHCVCPGAFTYGTEGLDSNLKKLDASRLWLTNFGSGLTLLSMMERSFLNPAMENIWLCVPWGEAAVWMTPVTQREGSAALCKRPPTLSSTDLGRGKNVCLP